jgi:hypothetical protein
MQLPTGKPRPGQSKWRCAERLSHAHRSSAHRVGNTPRWGICATNRPRLGSQGWVRPGAPDRGFTDLDGTRPPSGARTVRPAEVVRRRGRDVRLLARRTCTSLRPRTRYWPPARPRSVRLLRRRLRPLASGDIYETWPTPASSCTRRATHPARQTRVDSASTASQRRLD